MTDLRDILLSGRAPNDDLNTSTGVAKKMAAYFGILFDYTETNAKVLGLFINTRANGPVEAGMINIDEVEPEPGDDLRFFYQLQVASDALPEQFWDVSQWVATIESGNIESATRKYMGLIDPQFTYLSFPPTLEGITAVLNGIYLES